MPVTLPLFPARFDCRRAVLAAIMAPALSGCALLAPECVPAGGWVSPATRMVIADPLPAAAHLAVVLLGEEHDSAPDHRWQARSIETLYAVQPHMAFGFEMFPRQVQPVLDRWSKGELTEAAFLDQVDWKKIWGRDPELYMPMFRFARDHRLPMIALNVSSDLPRRVSREGWAKIPPAERESIGDPAPALPAYRKELEDAMGGHSQKSVKDETLDRFVEAQLLWDRAMAEAIAAARRGPNPPLVVGIMGEGHIAHFYGVPYQLKALGVGDVATFMPWHVGEDSCRDDLDPNLADAVYGTVGGAAKEPSSQP